MRRTIVFIGSFLVGYITFVSCVSEKDAYSSREEYIQTFSGVNSTTWTYISLSKQIVVGTSLFGSAKEDAEWKKRTDWDLAISGKYLRTNSGSSGEGKGGLLKVKGFSYELIESSVSGDFEIDIEQ